MSDENESNWDRCLRLAREHDKDKLIRQLMTYIAEKTKRSRMPLWSHIGDATSHGSGVSSALCEIYGVNPDTGEVKK